MWKPAGTVILGLTLSLAACSYPRTGQSEVRSAPAVPSEDLFPDLISATVTRVIDGNTIEVRLNGKSEEVRLAGVEAPEDGRYGREAAAFTNRELSGQTVYLEPATRQRDEDGRLLVYVWRAPPGRADEREVLLWMFNARLLLDGHARTRTVPPNVRYADVFHKLQGKAREAKRGLWGASGFGRPAPPGPDDAVNNGYQSGVVVEATPGGMLIKTSDRGNVVLRLSHATEVWEGLWVGGIPVGAGDRVIAWGRRQADGSLDVAKLWVNIVNLIGPISKTEKGAGGPRLHVRDRHMGSMIVRIDQRTAVPGRNGQRAPFGSEPVDLLQGQRVQVIGRQLGDGSVLATNLLVD